MYRDSFQFFLRWCLSSSIRVAFVRVLLVTFFHSSIYADARYVDLNNSTPSEPYTTWASAATTIQAAIDIANSNDTILVTDGTYLISSEINISKDCVVRSENGPEVTIIDGGGSRRCLYLGAENVEIDGFTIVNGSNRSGAGLYILNRALIENCIITNNYASGSSKTEGGGGCYVAGSLVLNKCAFNNNTAYRTPGGAINILASGSLMATNCSFSGNSSVPPYNGGRGGAINNAGGANSLTIVNCVFAQNTSHFGGAILAGGAMITDSLFESNSATYGGCIYSDGLTLNNTIFANNSATTSGGAILGGGGMIDNCMFFRNSCGRDYNPGAIEGSAYVSHCEFIENGPVDISFNVTVISNGLNSTFSDFDYDGADTYTEWVWNHNQIVYEEPFYIEGVMPVSVTIPAASSQRQYSLEGTTDLTSTNWTIIQEFTGGESSVEVDVTPYSNIFYRVRVSIP